LPNLKINCSIKRKLCVANPDKGFLFWEGST